MNKVRVKIKRTVAAFLAFCMLLSTFNGVAWADTGTPDDDYYPESRDVVFKLDANQMWNEAALAVQNGIMGQEAVTLESLGLSAQNKSNVKNAYAGLFADENSQIFEMVVPYAFDENNDENNNWMYEIPDGASMRMFVRVPNQVASSSNAEENEEYSLNGEENFLFLFINNSDYDLTFSVEVNNKRTKPVEVPYKDSIAAKRATDSNPVFPGGAPAQSTAVTEPVTSVAESSTVNPSETSAVESTDVTAPSTEESSTAASDAFTEESTTAGEASAETGTSAIDEGTEAETSADSIEKTTEAVEKDTTEAAAENKTEAAAEASTEDKTEVAAETETEKETEAAKEETEKETEAAAEQKEEPAEVSEEKEEPAEAAVTVSKSKHETVLVASAMEDGWEPQSPDEDPELMDDEDDEEYPGYLDEEEKAEENETVEIVTGTVLKAVLLGSEGSNGLFAAFIGNSGSEEGSARLTEVKGSDLLKAKETESLFKVTLYDYSGTGGDGSQQKINNYLNGSNIKLGNGFRFNGGDGPQNNFKSNNKNVNIVQGITEPELSSDGVLINHYTKADLFPDKQPSNVPTDTLKVYENVDANQLFKMNNDGYYEFDSSQVGGKYVAGTNALVPLNDSEKNGNAYRNAEGIQDGAGKVGFWPFKKTNWFFGMKVAFDFSVLEDGMYNGEQMEFEFRGDDDVWVYLTDKNDNSHKGKIVLDVGGNHNAMGGTINFATGEIAYKKVHPNIENSQVVSFHYDGNNPKTGPNKMTRYPETISPKAYLYTLEDAIATLGYSEAIVKSMYPLGFMGLKRQELAEYTLNFYYLERGGKGSNCYLRFNMPVIEKDEITLNKRVYSEDEADKTREYKFDLYYRTKGSSEFEAYDDNPIILDGDTHATKIIGKKFLEGTEYYFVERNNSASATRWTNAKLNGLQSPTYVVGENNSVVCSNYFEMNPTVEKEANLIGDDGSYEITLGVNGNTLTADEGDNEEYLTNIVATDPLSEYVDFADYDINIGPALSLIADGAKLQLVSGKIGDGLYRYMLAGTDTVVADVDVTNKVIKWFVTKENDIEDTLKKGQVKYLIYTVRTTDKAVYYGNGEYPHTGASSTGTHAGKKGYYSNGIEGTQLEAAVLDSNTTLGTPNEQLKFPQPVVRPTEKGVLTVAKELADGAEEPADGTEFVFTVKANNVAADYVVRAYRGDFKQIAVVNGELNDKIALEAEESCIYSGLNEAAEYSVKEEAYISDIYRSEVEKIVTVKDGVSDTKTNTNAAQGFISKVEMVTFYNTFSTMTKPVLNLTKVVSGADAPVHTTAERYEYLIQNNNGTVFSEYTWNGQKPVELSNGELGFIIDGAYQGSDYNVKIVFNNALERGKFQLVELNSGTATDIAWSIDGTEASKTNTLEFELTDASIEAGIKLTCENIYDKNELSIVKHVVGENSIPDAWYKFDVQFLNRKGNPGLEEGQLVTATLVSGKAKLNTNDAEELIKGDAVMLKIGADGKLTVYMTADAEVRLNGILRGTECKVSEDLAGFDSLYYKTRLESVDKTVTLADGTAKPVKADINDIGHKFDAGSREEAKFVFNNAMEAVRMNLSITKQLVDEAGAPKKDIEDVSFVFKITDNDKNSPNLNNVFYKRISISAQKEQPENTITIYNLPYSQDYQVEEMGQMRYQVVGDSIQSAVPVKNGDGGFEAAVVFKNRKMEESLFSNTSVTTNKFVLDKNDGSYVFERNNDMPNDRLPQPEALVAYDLPRKPKTGNYGSDGFDDGDTQLV